MWIFQNYKTFVISADPIVHLVLIRVKFRDNSLTSATMVLFDSKSAQLGSSSESQMKHLIADPFFVVSVCVYVCWEREHICKITRWHPIQVLKRYLKQNKKTIFIWLDFLDVNLRIRFSRMKFTQDISIKVIPSIHRRRHTKEFFE